MNINDIIQSALSLSEKYKTSTQTERLRSLAEAIKQDKLKVVVLGDFKAGKSTLLNRLFIRKDMLPTDHLEATAVPTHLSNGSMGMNTWMRNPDGEDVLVTERRTFTDADVAATVTAATEEERASKAQRYSRVSITMPGILPENITLVDTPGLNTTNTAIYTGTLEEARTADAILYVVRAKQLSTREECLIADLAGGQQLKVPVHVILTHDAAANIAEAQLQEICQTIQAQLKLCKVNCGVSVFALDGNQSDTPAMVNMIDASFDEDFSFATSAATPAAPTSAPTGTLEEELLAFFNGEVRQGRSARIARELAPVLLSLKSAVQTRLSIASANEDEIKKIEAKKQEIQEEYLRVVKGLLLDIRTAQGTFHAHVEEGLIALRDHHIKELNALDRTGDILAAIGQWYDTIPSKVQRTLSLRRIELERDINCIMNKHAQEISASQESQMLPGVVPTEMPTDVFTRIIRIIPTWALTIADYLIFDTLSPLPILLDIPTRMLLEKIPGIKDFLPVNIAANIARKIATDKLTTLISNVQQQLREQLQLQFNDLNKKLETQLKETDIFAEQEAAIAEFRTGTLTPAQKRQLTAEMEQIAQWKLSL